LAGAPDHRAARVSALKVKMLRVPQLPICKNGEMNKMSEPEVRSALDALEGWDLRDGKLHREYRFPDFVHAFGFMAAAAVAIEAMNHHPEWFNVWNRVVVDLWTHDSGGITSKDIKLAGKLEALAKRML
jgi:4a-hydroxytetrahydrobiopterin dehydratase